LLFFLCIMDTDLPALLSCPFFCFSDFIPMVYLVFVDFHVNGNDN
jgi:hypothetical protein